MRGSGSVAAVGRGIELDRLQSDIAQVQHASAGFGTGRLVAENLVLTAAHTLSNTTGGTDPVLDGWQVRLARDRHQGSWRFRNDNRVVWHDRARDLALIELIDAADGPLRPELRLRVATVLRNGQYPAEARGYPRASKQDEGPRQLTPALGRLTAGDRDQPLRFGVDVCDLPNNPHAGWPGMSGSAVVARGEPGQDEIWVYGVVQAVPQNFDGLLTVARLADAWQEDVAFRALLVAAGVPDRPVDDPTGRIAFGPNPYKGLEYFDKADADRFFGREALTEKLYERLIDLLDADLRLLPVLGPSGSGKSSLVRAGLVPRLSQSPNRLLNSAARVSADTRLAPARGSGPHPRPARDGRRDPGIQNG